MVDLRKGITALALLVLFVGLASAQVGGTGQQQLTCNTNVTVTPQLRNEGWTEQTGDITITCTGGATPVLNSVIPLVNFTIFYNTTVTSRLFGSTSSNIPNEALLLVDEPGAGPVKADGSGLPGYGPSLPQILCTTPLTGCAAYVGNIGGNTTPVTAVGGQVNAPNVYQGVAASATGNAVTFFGVPVMPPTTTGSRVFRITNVRVNAVPLASGAAGGAAAVIASVAISGATSLGIQNSSLTVGYVSASLTTGAGSATMTQCNTSTRNYISALTFTENFGTAFKTRVAAQTNTSYAGQNAPTGVAPYAQNVPGAIYNSESNFVFSTGSTIPAGLADFGTRLKATFNNIPTGVRIFVSTTNIVNGAIAAPIPGVIGGSVANGTSTSTSQTSYAALVNGENTAWTSTGNPFLVQPTGSSDIVGNVALVEVPLSGGTGSAVWEVINTNPNTNETFTFGVYATLASNTAQNIPLPGVSTVNLSYAPTATSGSASGANLPRFQGDSQAARTLLTVIICRTILLYPYIVNQMVSTLVSWLRIRRRIRSPPAARLRLHRTARAR